MDSERNDCAIIDILEEMENVMAQATHAFCGSHNGGADEFHGLEKIQKNNPSTFKERYDHEGAQIWIQEIEKIFRVMECGAENKVLSRTHTLYKEDAYG